MAKEPAKKSSVFFTQRLWDLVARQSKVERQSVSRFVREATIAALAERGIKYDE